MKESIKELRIRIDGIAQLAKELKPIKTFIESAYQKDLNNTEIGENLEIRGIREDINSKEIEKAVDSLYLAKCWLGKVGELGESTPYTNDGKRKTVDDIEPAADKDSDNGDCIYPFLLTVVEWSNKNHIEKVDWLRQEIEKLVNEITKLKSKLSDSTFNIFNEKESAIKAAIASTNTYNHLSEARFWLGFELSRLRDEKIER